MSSTPDQSSAVRPSDVDPWIGRIVDQRYRVEEHLGEGGMGAVFVAEHLKLHKQVALKIIHPEFAGDGEVAARFAREAMASAQLDHPHVASALDYGTLPEGGAYLVMQLVRGMSLQQLVDREGAQAWPRACEVGAQVADALAAAHAKGIVHRDLKPENVLLEPRDDGSVLVKVLDFGIARVATVEGRPAPEGAAPGRALTRVGTVMGTPGYMAPEQAMGESVDARADLYSLGVALWEMIAGRTMFDTRDLTAIVTRQLTQDPPKLRDVVGPAIPEALDALVAALLARTPADRPASAAAVRDQLRALAFGASGSLPSPVYGPGDTGRHDPAIARTMLADTGSTGARPAVIGAPSVVASLGRMADSFHARPRAWLAGFGALGVVVVVVTLVIAFAGGGGEEASAEDDATATPPAAGFSLGGLLDPVGEALSSVPPEVQEKIDDLVNGDRSRKREQAARWLRRHDPASEVPEWALVGADLELARTCEVRRTAILRLGEIGEDAALPIVMRAYSAPRNGCGRFFRRYDCYACVRDDLPSVIDDLGGEVPATNE